MSSYCANIMEYPVYSKISGLNQAGRGLFVREFLPAKSIITEYGGVRIDNTMAKSLRDIGLDSHIISLTAGYTCLHGFKYVNVGDLPDYDRKLGSLANDVLCAQCTNAKYIKKYCKTCMDYHVFLKATRDIMKDQEVFVSYGKGYPWIKLMGFVPYSCLGHVPLMDADLATAAMMHESSGRDDYDDLVWE